MVDQNLLKALQLDEGFKSKPYKDTVGKLTIGFGRNLDDVGISLTEAMIMLTSDVEKLIPKLERLSWFKNLSQVRKNVITNMAFNTGLAQLMQFSNMIDAISKLDFARASNEMLMSKWASQVKDRAKRLANEMKTGNV